MQRIAWYQAERLRHLFFKRRNVTFFSWRSRRTTRGLDVQLVSALTDVGDLDFLDVADVQAKSQAADEAHAGLAREVNTVKALLRFASEQVVTRRQQTVLRREHVAAATIEQVGKLEGSSSLDLRFTPGEYGGDLEGGAGSVLFSSPCWPPRGVGGIVILCLVMSFLVWEERSHSHRARKVAVELREARASTAKANGVVSALREELGDARRETARVTCKIGATEEALGRKVGGVCGDWVVVVFGGVVCCFSWRVRLFFLFFVRYVLCSLFHVEAVGREVCGDSLVPRE